MFARDGGDRFKRKNIDARVAQRLAVNNFCVGTNRAAKIFGVARVYQGHINADARKRVHKLIVCAAIQRRSGNDMVARAAQSENCHRLRGVPRTRRQRADAAFQIRDALLKHIRRRIHDARVNVAKFLQ